MRMLNLLTNRLSKRQRFLATTTQPFYLTILAAYSDGSKDQISTNPWSLNAVKRNTQPSNNMISFSLKNLTSSTPNYLMTSNEGKMLWKIGRNFVFWLCCYKFVATRLSRKKARICTSKIKKSLVVSWKKSRPTLLTRKTSIRWCGTWLSA